MDIKKLFFESVAKDKVIAAIKEPKHLEKFLESDIKAAFLLTGNISVIKRYVDLLKSHNRYVFLHIEKIPGISQDKEGLRFIAKYVQPTGIVTTKGALIQIAKKEGLVAIQRLFLIDSEATENGLRNCEEIQPDALEIMPGLLPSIIRKIKAKTEIPIITGGLIQNNSQIDEVLNSGALAVSIGRYWLWAAKEIASESEKETEVIRG